MSKKIRCIDLKTSEGKVILRLAIYERECEEEEAAEVSDKQEEGKKRNPEKSEKKDVHQMTDAQKRYLFRLLAGRGIEKDKAHGKGLDVNLEGFIDLIEEDDGIVEFKTSNQTMKQKDVDENLQLTAYSYAYEILYQKSPKRIKVVDFVKTKRPKRIEFETKRDKRDYQRLFSLALQVLRGIQEEIFFPRTGFWCKNCEYADLCKNWQVDRTEATR